MKNKLLSLFTAGVMFASATAMPPVIAADQPSMDSVIGTLPDWTPMNFVDAMQFYNTYGKSHVEDNFICLVKPIRLDRNDQDFRCKAVSDQAPERWQGLQHR